MVALWRWRHTVVAYMLVALLTTTQLAAGAARGDRGFESRGLQQTHTEFVEIRFLGGKSGKELCSGALVRPSVVLTSAHCASNDNLSSVTVTVATQQHEVPVLTKQTSAHAQFEATYAFANNVALVFLNISATIGTTEDQQQPRAWPLVSLPSSTIMPSQVPAFQEIQVRTEGAAFSRLANFSRDACVEDPAFASDTSVWCSCAPSENSSAGAHLQDKFDDCSPTMTETALLGSPVVVETQDANGGIGLTIIGLRLTSSCSERHAFVYIPSVLDFIASHFQPTTSLPDLSQTVGFETITNDTSVGKVSPGREEELAPIASSSDSSSSLNDDVGVDISRSGEDATIDKGFSYFGGWLNLPSLGEFGVHAAFVTRNTTEAFDELEACVGVLIAPTFMIADGCCTRFMSELQVVVVRDAPAAQDNTSSTEQQVYAIINVSRHQEYASSLAVLELERPIDGMIPLSISRSLSKEYHVTDKSWTLVSMDNIFASARENQQIVTKQSIVRLPTTTCNVNHYEEIPFAWCMALGSESDRQKVLGFSQGFVLHDKMLVALPQCYSSICPGGLFQIASFLAAKEDWIREQTRNTALWDAAPLDKSAISHEGVDKDDSVLPKAATYAILVDGSRNSSGNETASCSGVLIAPSFVLTTASCVVNATISHVRLGLDKHVSHYDNFEESTTNVRAIHVHPGFRKKSAGDNEVNDLALIELGGMAYFVPTLLEQDDTLKVQNRTLSNSSASAENNDALTANYSWPISLSPVDGSALCVAEEATDVLSETSSGTAPPKTNIINCSLIETRLDKLQGDGLIGAFAEGDSLLGIRLSSCARAHNGGAVDVCALSPRPRPHSHVPACYARVASPSAKEFIDSVSVDHTWRVSWNAGGVGRAFPFLAKEAVAITPITTTIAPDDPGYTGSLEYDPLSSQTQVGFVVGLRKDKSGQNFCGGSLIAPSYVLTAAHCVVGGEAKYVSVGSRASAGTETELIPVKPGKVIVHPLYGKRSGISYDVAILELAYQAYPAPIQLDNALAFDASTQFTLFGYGANSAGSRTLSPVMRSVELPYFDRTSCAKFFPELDDSMLCAGGQPARDACTGDSGSPLVYYRDGKPVLVGVVSTGRNGCGTPGVPGIYGYVSTMQGFVNSYTAGCSWIDPNKKTASLDSALSSGIPSSGSTQPEPATSARTSLEESNENQIPFEIVHSSTGADEHQLSVVKLAADTPPLLQDAVKAFLLGGYSMIGGTLERISNEIRAAETTITFYSSGEMLDLMKAIAKYSSKPLNQRKSRFGTRFDETTSSANCYDRA